MAVRLYTDTGARATEYQDYQIEKFGLVTLPMYAILTPDGETEIARLPEDPGSSGVVSEEEVLAFLRKAP